MVRVTIHRRKVVNAHPAQEGHTILDLLLKPVFNVQKDRSLTVKEADGKHNVYLVKNNTFSLIARIVFYFQNSHSLDQGLYIDSRSYNVHYTYVSSVDN